MRSTTLLIALSAWAFAAVATADPQVELRHAAARVVVIPEARGDIAVDVVRPSRRLPLRVTHTGDHVFVTGDVGKRLRGCRSAVGRLAVSVSGLGDIVLDDLPQVVIRTPMNVRLRAGDAVFGSVGRSDSLDFQNLGCGDWAVGNVAGRLRISQAGSGNSRVGQAGSADLSLAGSGDIVTQDIRGGLVAVVGGSGNITATSLTGPLVARVAGSGDIRVGHGQVTDMNASIAGSGDVSFGGVAQTLHASVAGSGDVRVVEVRGPVVKRLLGSGQVHIGP